LLLCFSCNCLPAIQHSTQMKMAVLCRLVMPEHTLPFDLKSKDLLECEGFEGFEGFEVEDYSLETREDSSVRFDTSHPRNIHFVE
jgi:hypothetical protein